MNDKNKYGWIKTTSNLLKIKRIWSRPEDQGFCVAKHPWFNALKSVEGFIFRVFGVFWNSVKIFPICTLKYTKSCPIYMLLVQSLMQLNNEARYVCHQPLMNLMHQVLVIILYLHLLYSQHHTKSTVDRIWFRIREKGTNILGIFGKIGETLTTARWMSL